MASGYQITRFEVPAAQNGPNLDLTYAILLHGATLAELRVAGPQLTAAGNIVNVTNWSGRMWARLRPPTDAAYMDDADGWGVVPGAVFLDQGAVPLTDTFQQLDRYTAIAFQIITLVTNGVPLWVEIGR